MNDTAECVRLWVPLICAAANRHGLEPRLVAAIVAQESSGIQWAIRPEPGFWRRYLSGIRALVKRTASKRDDHWAQYPDLASASFGLMQPLYVVALEYGYDLDYPTRLCDPEVNLDVGCRHLAAKLQEAKGDVRNALLRWNGGGNPRYPDEVLYKLQQIKQSGLFDA